jgi:UDP-galactopyranose mutase
MLIDRLAEYRYYDMDDVVKRALEVFEERVK